jgi:glyoxylase-like metal-dependent hydrolase (beta-lactamase superfamily II)
LTGRTTRRRCVSSHPNEPTLKAFFLVTSSKKPETPLEFPLPTPPEVGQAITVAPGILWLRLALPFRLDHVNIYLIEDGAGYTVVDTGIGNDETRAVWETLLDGIFRARPINRIIATHFHPDHVGMAGWLCERLNVPLLMSQTEYLTSLNAHLDPHSLESEPYRSFYLGHGLDEDATDKLLANGHRYLRMVTGLPRTFRRLIAGEVLRIGSRDFEVFTGGGHAPEQVMLYCPGDKLLLCADQVLARISPNISVQAMDPQGDPLGIYLRSLASLKASLPADTLVLPGHNLPFVGLHLRIDDLGAHHAARCQAIVEACSTSGHTVAELVPVVFSRPIDDPHQMGFAFSEAMAHVNLLQRQGRLFFAGGKYHAGASPPHV